MAQYRTPFHAPPPKYMQHHTDIKAPSVRTDWVNGRAKYTLIPPEIGSIQILDSDDEDEVKPVIMRLQDPRIKREHSHAPSRALHRSQSQGRHSRIKQEPSAKNLWGHRNHRISSSPTDFHRRRQPENNVRSYRGSNVGYPAGPPGDTSSSSSDSSSALSAPDSQRVSSPEYPGFPFDHSSSSSSDDTDSDVYTPSTSPSRISSTSPRTRQQSAREATTKLEPGATPREPKIAEERKGSEHVPLDFYIDVPMRSGQPQPGEGEASKPQGSSPRVPRPQVKQKARTQTPSRFSSHKSAKVLGFLPINHEPPPANAPTEPRAMRPANPQQGDPSGSLPRSRLHNVIEPVKARTPFASKGLPPAGVRPLGSTRPELGLQRPVNAVNRAVRSDSAALRLMSQAHARPNTLSSQTQSRTRFDATGQSGTALPSSTGTQQGQSREACPTVSSSQHLYQSHQSSSGPSKNPASQTVEPCARLPASSPASFANTSPRSESAFPSPGKIGNKSKSRRQQESPRRRGPARPGRMMQTVENPGMEVSLSPSTPPLHNLWSRPYRPATPGPSSSRLPPSHPQSSPGLFVTPDSPFQIRPFASSPTRSAVSRGKRPREETEELDPAARRLEWERMMQRMRNHETEMEETRGRLEKASQMLEDQQRRIEDLEQKRRIDELVKELEQHNPVAFEHDNVGGSSRTHVEVEAPQNQENVQPERRREHRRRHERQQQHHRSIEMEQPGTRQLKPERRRHAHKMPDQRQNSDGQGHRALDTPSPPERNELGVMAAARPVGDARRSIPALSEEQKEMQRAFKSEVLDLALSGHNPKLVFGDDDRPIVSEATVFLLRLSQQEVLNRFSKYIKDKEFFDVSHPSFMSMGCWIVSAEACGDYKMKLSDKGEKHTFSFSRLAIRLWHDEESMYSLLQGKTLQKAILVCHNEQCMNPGHIQVESGKESAERRKCKARGRCGGHTTAHKDGTIQRRLRCIFPHQPL